MAQLRLVDSQSKRRTFDERVCCVCMGHRNLCGIRPCPLILRARVLSRIDKEFRRMSLEGSSPPSAFVGSYGYPKVLAGPLVPPLRGETTAIMERPDLWVDKTIDEIIALRFSLVRTKCSIPVTAAVDPPRLLAETQTMALSESPVDSEAKLLKRPEFTSIISERTLPIGPSAPLQSFQLEDNPKVPRPVDKVTSDTDLRAVEGLVTLFDEGIHQEHLTRLFSLGLLGIRKRRRLVPTEWSITAVDDIVGKELHKRVLRNPAINHFQVFTYHALGNTVSILMLPSNWQYEALECWLSDSRSPVISDHELSWGRKSYATHVVGAYYAVRLPVLEFLDRIRRQAGVVSFLEVNPKEWAPLGVWRFREIARRALNSSPQKFSDLSEAIDALSKSLKNSINEYLKASRVLEHYQTQTRITDFL